MTEASEPVTTPQLSANPAPYQERLREPPGAPDVLLVRLPVPLRARWVLGALVRRALERGGPLLRAGRARELLRKLLSEHSAMSDQQVRSSLEDVDDAVLLYTLEVAGPDNGDVAAQTSQPRTQRVWQTNRAPGGTLDGERRFSGATGRTDQRRRTHLSTRARRMPEWVISLQHRDRVASRVPVGSKSQQGPSSYSETCSNLGCVRCLRKETPNAT